jgi:hypothetical protein
MPAQMVDAATCHHYLHYHYLPDVNLPWKVLRNVIFSVPILSPGVTLVISRPFLFAPGHPFRHCHSLAITLFSLLWCLG